MNNTNYQEKLKLNWSLIIAALLLIGVGAIETVFFYKAIVNGGNFSGGAFIYIVFGFLIILKRKKTYESVRKGITIFLFLSMVGVCVIIEWVIWYFLAYDSTVSYGGRFDLVLIMYGVSFPLIVAFLNHPSSRYSMNCEASTEGYWWTCYINLKSFWGMLTGAFVVSLLMTGPHCLKNPLKSMILEFNRTQEVKQKVGEIQAMSFDIKGIHNWNLWSEWEIQGSEFIAVYRVHVDPRRDMDFELVAYRDLEGNHPWSATEFSKPQIDEFCITDYQKQNMVILLSTSFENLSPSNPNGISPFLNVKENEWRLDTRSRSGKYSLNAIPGGNKREKPISFFSAFKSRQEEEGVLLNSTCTDVYEPFNVIGFNSIIVEFWRYSTSSPETDDFCRGSINVKYRLDNQEWQYKNALCGRYKNRPKKEWERTELEFDIKGKSKLEIKLFYDYFFIEQWDETAVHLIDDLVVYGKF